MIEVVNLITKITSVIFFLFEIFLHFIIYRFIIENGKDVSKMINLVKTNKLNNGENSVFAHGFAQK